MVIIGRRSSKKKFGANNRKIPSFYILEIIEIVKASPCSIATVFYNIFSSVISEVRHIALHSVFIVV